VCSAVVLLVFNEKNSTSQDQFEIHSFHETTDVKFTSGLSDEILEHYVDTGEPM